MGDANNKPKTIGLSYRIIANCIHFLLTLFLVSNFLLILIIFHMPPFGLLFLQEVCAVIALLNLILYLITRYRLRLNPKNKRANSAMTVVKILTIIMALNGYFVLGQYLSYFKYMDGSTALLTMGKIVGGTLIGYSIVSEAIRKIYRLKTGTAPRGELTE